MVSKADSDFHNLVAKTKEEMGDVLNDDNEQENDDEPVQKRVCLFFTKFFRLCKKAITTKVMTKAMK
jgi:hypothetical protein